MNFFFQIDCSFEIDFISRKFIFTHSRQIGEYLSKEVWDMDNFVDQEVREEDKLQFLKYLDLALDVIIKKNKDVQSKKKHIYIHS